MRSDILDAVLGPSSNTLKIDTWFSSLRFSGTPRRDGAVTLSPRLLLLDNSYPRVNF